MNMKKILYMFLLLTVFGFIQPTTVMAGQPPSDHQIACSYLEYEVCVTTPGCYIYYYYDEDNKRVAECRQCPADFYCGGGYSLPCPDDTSSPPQSKSIEDCKVPETCAESYSETICVSSNLGCEWSSSDNKCVKCPSGYYCDSPPINTLVRQDTHLMKVQEPKTNAKLFAQSTKQMRIGVQRRQDVITMMLQEDVRIAPRIIIAVPKKRKKHRVRLGPSLMKVQKV